jgi:hypothetical protein
MPSSSSSPYPYVVSPEAVPARSGLAPEVDPVYRALHPLPGEVEEGEFDAYIDAQRSEVRQIVANAVGKEADPRYQEAIVRTGAIFEELMYGLPGDPLPEELAVVQDQHGNKHLDFHLDSPLQAETYSYVINNLLMPAGLGEHLQHNRDTIEMSEDQIKHHLVEVVQATPEFAFLLSFQAEPPTEQVDQPLNAFWRQVKEAQAEQTIRDQIGLPRPASLVTQPGADRALRKAHQDIDDMTAPRAEKKEVTPEDPLIKFYTHVLDVLSESLRQKGWGTECLGPAQPMGEGRLLVAGVGGELQRRWLGDLREDTSLMPERRTHDGFPYPAALWAKVTATAVKEILFNFEDYNTYQELLDKVTDDAAGLLYTQLLNTMSQERAGNLHKKFDDPRLLPWLRQPDGPVFDADQVRDRRSITQFGYRSPAPGSRFTTRDEMRRLQRQTFAHVVKRPWPADRPESPRIIQTVSRGKYTPDFDPADADMIIAFREDVGVTHPNYGLVAGQPVITGYKTIGHDAEYNRWGFARREEHDPHSPAHIALPEREAMRVIDRYRDLGLVSLANSLERQDQPTVEQLRKLLSRQRYAFADEVKEPDKIRGTWEDYRDLVWKGRLHVQCDSASDFLNLALDEMFGPASVDRIEGYVLPGQTRRINSVPHAQSVLYRGDNSHILDATPSRVDRNWGLMGVGVPRGGLLKDIVSVVPLSRRRKAPASQLLQPIEVPPLQPLDSSANRVMQRGRESHAALHNLEQQLAVIYDAPVARMYERVGQLPATHPLRRTVAAARLAVRGEIDQQEAAILSGYLDAHAETGQLAPDTLAILRGTARRMDAFVPESLPPRHPDPPQDFVT